MVCAHCTIFSLLVLSTRRYSRIRVSENTKVLLMEIFKKKIELSATLVD